MAGGTWIPGVDKVRPGTYINFKSARPKTSSLENRGTVIVPLFDLDYYQEGKFIEITNENPNVAEDKLGVNILDDKMLLVREALKRASTVLVYVPAGEGGARAKASIEPLTIEAKYTGEKGNNIKVSISEGVIKGKDIEVYMGTSLLFMQSGVTKVEDLKENDYVVFTGEGELKSGTVTLEGGKNATISNKSIMDFLDDVESQEFNTLCFPKEDAELQTALKTKIKYLRDNTGKKVIAVTSNFDTADTEGIINVKNGVVLADGTKLSAVQCTAWVAAASAAATAAQSLTYVAYDDSIDVNGRLTHLETEKALLSGQFVFSVLNKQAVVEQDINSLVNLTADQDEGYKKNRVIRAFDAFANTAKKQLPPNKYDNDDDGHALTKDALVKVLLNMQSSKAVKNVDTDNDVVINKELSIGDACYADIGMQPVDAIEKYYFTVRTR